MFINNKIIVKKKKRIGSTKRTCVHDVKPSFINKNSYKSNKSTACGHDTYSYTECWSFVRFIYIDAIFNVFMISFCLGTKIKHYPLR